MLGIRILLLLAASVPLWSYLNQDNDVQLWVIENFDKQLSQDFNIDVSNQWRFGDDMSFLHLIYLQGVLGYRLTDEAWLASGYRQIWERSQTSSWRLVYDPFIELVLQRLRGRFQLDFRNRVAYFDREVGQNNWQWRGRIRWIVADGILHPYVSNELFMDFRTGFDQNRAIGGCLISFVEHVQGDFYYMLRCLNQQTRVVYQHIFGAGIDFNF